MNNWQDDILNSDSYFSDEYFEPVSWESLDEQAFNKLWATEDVKDKELYNNLSEEIKDYLEKR